MGLMSHDSRGSYTGGPLPIAAVILAAGMSTRMGRFKLTLPWNGTTVIGRVVETVAEAGVADVVLVTGHRADEVRRALADRSFRAVRNPDYRAGEMLTSVQVGLRAMHAATAAALLCLGDQPQMSVKTVLAILEASREDHWERIIVPSYQGRGGHPILLPRGVWASVWETHGTLRDAMTLNRGAIRYLDVDTATVLADLDTPEDYSDQQGSG
jgi:molybdenum cofactor cytidylyltransferase